MIIDKRRYINDHNRKPLGTVRGVVIHHSVTTPKTLFNVINGNGGMGYHYVIVEQDGKTETWQLYDDKNVAWHAGDVKEKYKATELSKYAANPNNVTIGIAFCGTFTDNPPSNAMMLECYGLIDYLCKKFPELYLAYAHNQFTATICPGKTDVASIQYRINIARNKEVKKVYKYLEDLPNWAQNDIDGLVSENVINGVGVDANGKIILNLTDDLLRSIIVTKRLIEKYVTAGVKQ